MYAKIPHSVSSFQDPDTATIKNIKKRVESSLTETPVRLIDGHHSPRATFGDHGDVMASTPG